MTNRGSINALTGTGFFTAHKDTFPATQAACQTTTDQRRAAARHIASKATNASDCAMLLDMLGIDIDEVLDDEI